MLLMTYLQKYILSKTKDVNVKTFNIITRINEAKTMVKHISCDFIGELHSNSGNLAFMNKVQFLLILRSFIFKVSKN